MDVQERMELVHDLQSGAEFGAAMFHGATQQQQQQQQQQLGSGTAGAVNDYTCGGGQAMDVWLAQPEVVKALHVRPNTAGMR
jgi:hypothetical protein